MKRPYDDYEFRDRFGGSRRTTDTSIALTPCGGQQRKGDGRIRIPSRNKRFQAPQGSPYRILRSRSGDGKLSKEEVPHDATVQLGKEVSKETPGNMLSCQMLLFEFFDANRDGIFSKDEGAVLEQFSVKNRNNLIAIRPGGGGNISTSHVQWQGSVGISEMPSRGWSART